MSGEGPLFSASDERAFFRENILGRPCTGLQLDRAGDVWLEFDGIWILQITKEKLQWYRKKPN